MSRPHIVIAIVATLALAVACDSSTAPSSEPVASPSEPARPEPAKAEPAEAEPPPQGGVATPPPAKAVPPEPAPSSPLHVVVHREGSMQLMHLHGALAVVLEGEPLPIVSGVPTRGKRGSHGLPNLAGYDSRGSTFAVGGTLDPSGTAWVSTGSEADRTASSYWVHRNRNQGLGWQQVDLRRGPLVAYHLAYVERDGALFGLRAWEPYLSDAYYESSGESPSAIREWKAVERAMAKVSRGFVRLQGPEVPTPEMPADARPQSAVTTDDGTIHLLSGDPGSKEVVLVWAPEQQVAERVELPDYDGNNATLVASGDVAMVMGWTKHGDDDEPYLAVGRGTKWERVPLSLPARAPGASTSIVSAARAPTGELWIAFGEPYRSNVHEPSLWHKPVDGTWGPVALPRFGDDMFGREEGYVYDVSGMGSESWRKVPRPSLEGVEPKATALAWAEGALWVVLELGPAYDEEDGMLGPTRRHVLLSTGPASAGQSRLPSRSELHVERLEAIGRSGTPGKGECKRPAFVLGPATLVETRPELAPAVRKTGEMLGDGPGVQIYVGRLDAAEVLVATARTDWPADVKKLRDALTEAVGAEPVVECRVPELVKMVQSP